MSLDRRHLPLDTAYPTQLHFAVVLLLILTGYALMTDDKIRMREMREKSGTKKEYEVHKLTGVRM